MKHLLVPMLLLGAAAWLRAAAPTHDLRVEMAPQFGGKPLAYDAITNTTAAKQRVSVTRLDLLISGIALRRDDGSWFTLSNTFAYVSGRENRTRFNLAAIPEGTYDRLRFQVGLPADVNHGDPAKHPVGHPLNPIVNGLHWSWQGGYVFLALEGAWAHASGETSGYSYHLANDENLATVELPLPLRLASDWELSLGLDVAQVFGAVHPIQLDQGAASTHSRKGDALAGQIRKNLERAFLLRSMRPRTVEPTVAGQAGDGSPASQRVEVAPTATPYGFTYAGYFPPPALPADNPLTKEGVRLGELLFHDPRLSVNNSQSCATCHQREAGFSDAGRAVSLGAEGQRGNRNAMPLFNLAWKSSFFWDGRTPTLREQVLQPIQNPIEMHETLERVVGKVARARASQASPALKPEILPASNGSTRERPATSYADYFTAAFGTPEVTAARIARALEQFLLVQVAHNSKFDRFIAGAARFTAEEQRGYELFHTEYDPRRGLFGADCFHCHGGPLFQNLPFANNGLDSEPGDLGRFLVTGKPGDKGKFAVPSLRNVALTSPYMHDGRFATLEEVVEHYSSGVKRGLTLDSTLAKHPTNGVALSAGDKRALVAFLKTLTDDVP